MQREKTETEEAAFKAAMSLHEQTPTMYIDSVKPVPNENQLNPFNLPLVPEGNRLALHIETRDITKGGIHLTEAAKKELAEAEAKKNSKLYFITAVSEGVYTTSKYRPGMWILLSPETMAHSCKIADTEMLLVEAYNIVGVVKDHVDEDVTSQYTSFEA